MKRRFRVIFLTIVTLLLLVGCGKEEERQLGVDGYIYVAKEVQWEVPSALDTNCVAGDSFYYFRLVNNEQVIERLPVDSIIKESVFPEGERVLAVSDIFSDAPEEMLELRKGKLGANILDYTVDDEQNLYCLLKFDGGIYSASAGGILCKYSPDGQLLYWLELPEIEIRKSSDLLAVDDKGGICLLNGDSILLVDSRGNRTGSVSVGAAEGENSDIKSYLMEGTGGKIYYVEDNYNGFTRRTSIVNTAEGRLQQVDTLSGHAEDTIHEVLDGLLLQKSEGMVYRYDSSQDSLNEMLNWEDSDLYGKDVRKIVQLKEDYILVLSGIWEETFYLCTKTSVEELPEKELLVMASLFPDDNLRKVVTEFNRASDKYHISIESYGADFYGGDLNEGAYVRLNSSLVSKDTPDLLDLADLDIADYMESGALEDLYSYMGEDVIINRENYIGNLLEGYTIDGKLACIPKSFYFQPVFGVGDRMSSIEEWTMPVLMELTKKYPEAGLLDHWQRGSDYLLETFCAPYYLEQFVDWNNGSCSFDSEEFCELLSWIKDQGEDYVDFDDYLMADGYFYDFYNYVIMEWEKQEKLYALGYPSADGKGVFTASVSDAVGIVAKSRHKEGAWEFLKYYLSSDDYGIGFPTRKDLLAEQAEYDVTVEPWPYDDGTPRIDSDGNEMMMEKYHLNINGELVTFYAFEQEEIDVVLELINLLDFTPRSGLENSIVSIVSEEAVSFINGNKTAVEAAAVIQNRVQLLLKENN